ncbi:MAG: DUF3300 domain-containing protein [Terracidiphilus sp.]|jgi:hypothetical protein
MRTASNLCAFVSRVPSAAIVLAVVALAAAPAFLTAQQAYQPYSYPASPNGAPSNTYAQPSPQSNYAQPQVQQPQYGYAQPQYQQPQVQQPQYGYAQPQYQQPQDQQPQVPAQPSPQEPYEAPYPDQQLSQPAVPSQSLTADQLEQLLAPIALYPDALLAQILTASTYPAQVAVADQWLQQMRAQGYGSPDQIAAGADAQGDWDPSVKALTAFPDVLDLLNHDLDWTTALGDAYYNQPQDVMQTVQVLRDRAQQAGNLQTTPQEDVTGNQGYIDIAPPNPEVVYVPTYDPWDVYGAPIAPYPGFSLVGPLGSFFGGLPIQYGLSFALDAFDRTPFGLLSWGLDWMAHGVLFHHSGYFTASASVHDWGLPRGGPRAYNGAYNGWRQNQRAPGGYGNSDRRYQTPQNSYQNSNQRGTAYGNRAPAQNYTRQPEPTREPARPDAYSYRGAQQPAYGSTHPALPAQNYERPAPQNYAYHPQTYPNRAQTYSNPAYANRSQTFSNPGYGYANRSTQAYSGQAYRQQNYAARPAYGYSNSYPSYRAPQTNSRAYSGRSYEPYGNSMARNESGGFRGFSTQKQPKFSAPKFQAPRSYGGGHFSAPRTPSMSRSGGGGGRRR